jgi:hypothetical protein
MPILLMSIFTFCHQPAPTGPWQQGQIRIAALLLWRSVDDYTSRARLQRRSNRKDQMIDGITAKRHPCQGMD